MVVIFPNILTESLDDFEFDEIKEVTVNEVMESYAPYHNLVLIGAVGDNILHESAASRIGTRRLSERKIPRMRLVREGWQ